MEEADSKAVITMGAKQTQKWPALAGDQMMNFSPTAVTQLTTPAWCSARHSMKLNPLPKSLVYTATK